MELKVLQMANVDLLDKKIEEFKKINNKEPYIFSNKATAYAIKDAYFTLVKIPSEDDSCFGFYKNHRMYINSGMLYGEVELR